MDEKTVEVNRQQYTADHILIATGTEPTHPDIEGAELGIDSNGFLSWKSCLNAPPLLVQAILP